MKNRGKSGEHHIAAISYFKWNRNKMRCVHQAARFYAENDLLPCGPVLVLAEPGQDVQDFPHQAAGPGGDAVGGAGNTHQDGVDFS